MRHRYPLRCVVTVAVMALAAAASRANAQAPDDIGRLGWMAGCWELRTATRVMHEQWMAPLGGMMLGMSRTVVADVVREHETTRIEVVGGRAIYRAQPSGQAAAAFPAVALSDTMAIFANPAHDFPQRIAYHRRADGDSLLARIEGTRAGALRVIDFPMRRVACAGSVPGEHDS